MQQSQNARADHNESIGADQPQAQKINIYEQAVIDKRAGRLAAAERGFRAIVASHPAYAADFATPSPKGRTVSPSLAALNIALADMLVGRDRLDEALTVLQRAMLLEPCDASAPGRLGLVYEDLGRSIEACAAYRMAIGLDPTDALSLMRLARCSNRIGQVAAAVPPARRAVALAPHVLEAHVVLATALDQAGDRPGAVAACRDGLSRDPLNPEIAALLERWTAAQDLPRAEFPHGDAPRSDILQDEARQ